MVHEKYEIEKLKSAVEQGGIGDLRFACDFADRIVAAAQNAGDGENLNKGFKAFRARNDYTEDSETDPGQIHIYPLGGKKIGAPPADKTLLGRFNPPNHPVLYLSTTREVALSETRTLPTDTCTVAIFETVRPIKIATLLRHQQEPLSIFFEENPSDEAWQKWLLARTAEFVSRRISDHERDVHYRACNLIASAFKEQGYDGLAYRTSFWSPGWRDEKESVEIDNVRAANLVLFDPKIAEPVHSGLFSIDWKRPTAKVAGNSYWNKKTDT